MSGTPPTSGKGGHGKSGSGGMKKKKKVKKRESPALKSGKRVVKDSPQLRQEKVRRVIGDIVKAETSYVESLHLLVDRFLKPLKQMAQDGVVDGPKILKIFSNVEAISNFHDIFLAQLKGSAEKDVDDACGIADIFYKYADFLKMYTLYVNGYDRCCDTVDSLKGHKKFQEFLKSARKDKAMKGNNLMSFLIMPVQRLPVYEVLLERLLNAHKKKRKKPSPNTPKGRKKLAKQDSRSQEAIEKLTVALSKIHKVAEHVNENKRRAESRSRMLDLRGRLVGGGPGFNLVTPTRTFVKEGELLKVSTLGFKKKRKVILFNDLLLWCTGAYKIRGYMELALAIIVDEHPVGSDEEKSLSISETGKSRRRKKVTETEPARRRFEIIHPQKTNPLCLIAPTISKKAAWVRELRRCISAAAAERQDINLRRASLTGLTPRSTSSGDSNAGAAVQPHRASLGGFLAGTTPLADFLHTAAEIRRASEISTAGGGSQSQSQDEPTGPPEPPAAAPEDEPVAAKPNSPSTNGAGDSEPEDKKTDDSLLSSGSDRTAVHNVLHEVLHKTFQETVVKQLDMSIRSLQALTEEDVEDLFSLDEEEDEEILDEESKNSQRENVPVMVRKVLEAACIMMGIEPRISSRTGRANYWKPAKALIKKPYYFLRLLKGHAEKKFRISSEDMNLLKMYITNPLLQPKAVAELSYTAGVLWNWVRANYSAQSGVKLEMVLPSVPPKREKSEHSVSLSGSVSFKARTRRARSVKASRRVKNSKSMRLTSTGDNVHLARRALSKSPERPKRPKIRLKGSKKKKKN